MDSYEGFCARIQSDLQSQMMQHHTCSAAAARGVAHSFICFHGRAVLPPVLNDKQMREMVEDKKRALQLEAKRQIHYKNNLLNQIQAILWTSETPKILDVPDPIEQLTSHPLQREHNNGFAKHDTAKLTPSGTEPFILTSKTPVTPSAESSGVMKGNAGEENQIQEGVKTEEGCLQHLLKRSREFIEKEQGRQGSKVIGSKMVEPKVTPSLSPSDKENGGSLDGTGCGLPCYIPCGHPPSQTSRSPLISPESSLRARPHHGRPRPISAGSIFLTYPDDPSNHPSITANGRPQEMKTNMTQDALTPSRERRLLGVENVSLNRCDGHSRFNPLNETMNSLGRLETSQVELEVTSPLFRRRCHTLDSQPSSCHQFIDRSQERMPRFMAGVTPRTPTRLSPSSPLSKTFTRESPISAFIGSGLTPDSPSYAKLPFEIEGNSVIGTALKERRADETQWQVHAEEVQRPVEEDYTFRVSCLVAEQEREKLHLIQESEDRVWRLRGQGGLSPVAGEDGCELRAAGERYPVLSPMCPLSPGDRSSLHPVPSIGFPSNSLDIPSPSVQTPIYIRGLNNNTGKSRLSQVITADQQRALCHLCAIVKGFLTRRLLKTEKVKHLRQTVQDTQAFIHSFSSSSQRSERLCEQDLSLQERVRAQLRAALFDIHDIFFTMTLEERLSLLQQDRDVRTERKLREMEKAKNTKDKMILSAATQKSLDRKKQRVGESPGQTRKAHKNKSPPTKRILQPSQGQNALVSGQQFLRRGSYKKTPEERVRHSERLKKQHSLG